MHGCRTITIEAADVQPCSICPVLSVMNQMAAILHHVIQAFLYSHTKDIDCQFSKEVQRLEISLGTRPFARGRRKGSGHHLTFELSPGRNVDLTNQKR